MNIVLVQKARELYWTVTRLVGLGFIHDGSPNKLADRSRRLLQAMAVRLKECYWTATRLIGLGHFHDGSRTRVETSDLQALLQTVEGLRAYVRKLDAVQTNLDLLRIQADVARLQSDEIKEQVENSRLQLDEILGLHRKTRDEVKGLLRETQCQLTDLQTAVNFLPLDGRLMFRAPWGMILAPSEDSRLATVLWTSPNRQLESGTVRVIESLLGEGDYFIDVGANIGFILVPAARKVGSRGRILALEPGKRASGLLQETIALNGLEDRVDLHVCAAGEQAGMAPLFIGATLGHSSLLELPEAKNSEEVPVVPLDDLVEEGEVVRLVKIDAEGYELRVWRGMRRILLENPKLVAIVEFGPSHLQRAGESISDWIETFIRDGFSIYEIDELTGTLALLRPIEQLGAIVSVNLLLLRESSSNFPQLTFERFK